MLLQPGTSLSGIHGTYYIGAFIGHGAYGEVYDCRDEWGNDLVAKALHPSIPPEDWERERNALLLLRHPNITYIYDAFVVNRSMFCLIIEKCVSSLDRIASPPATTLPRIARDILQGLSFIHRQGFVHKDIHAGNVFLGQVRDKLVDWKEPVYCFKIGDLGISQPSYEIPMHTPPEGTPLAPWMLPPEAIKPDEFGQIDHRTDLYHAALLFLGVLHGQPLKFTPHQVVDGVPRTMAKQLGSPYSEPLATALRRHTRFRYQSALDFWRAMHQATPAGWL